ncbi:hypothetical protein RF11_10428 [Thelohanellus kitauei]|uniref:Uncharacterized protein n=1 Tax=Thelohanellus kitauei TaxID=669202 RepID=A0A0C2NFM1_THEKT|nr:hypothetical protein RF11_10428 [Thelohanellus kitauei]
MSLIVVKGNEGPICGFDWIRKYGLDFSQIKFVKCVTKHQEFIAGNLITLTALKGYEASIVLTDDANPVIHNPRRVPFPTKRQLEYELHRLVQSGALERIDPAKEKVSWAYSIVCVKKLNGSMRVCGDFKVSINKY